MGEGAVGGFAGHTAHGGARASGSPATERAREFLDLALCRVGPTSAEGAAEDASRSGVSVFTPESSWTAESSRPGDGLTLQPRCRAARDLRESDVSRWVELVVETGAGRRGAAARWREARPHPCPISASRCRRSVAGWMP